jgi:hypothetical protein
MLLYEEVPEGWWDCWIWPIATELRTRESFIISLFAFLSCSLKLHGSDKKTHPWYIHPYEENLSSIASLGDR